MGKLRKNATEFCTNIGRLQCVQLLRSGTRQTLLFVSQAQSCKGCLESKESTCQRQGQTSSGQSRENCLESKVSTCQRQGQTSSGQSRESKADWALLFASTCCKEGKDSGGKDSGGKDRGGWAERVQSSEGNSQAA